MRTIYGQITNFPIGDRFLNYSVRWRCQFLHDKFLVDNQFYLDYIFSAFLKVFLEGPGDFMFLRLFF